jgi:hypothetical protein
MVVFAPRVGIRLIADLFLAVSVMMDVKPNKNQTHPSNTWQGKHFKLTIKFLFALDGYTLKF